MNKSESITELAKAMAAFQGEVKNPSNTAENPYFNSKYAPLQDVLNTVRPLLSKHGLSIIQIPSSSEDGNRVIVKTLIMHTSGQWIESDPLILKMDKVTAQGAGSAITYARRYSLSALLGISSEDDDDGNFASKNAVDTKQNKANNTKKTSKTSSNDTITTTQAKHLFELAGDENVVRHVLDTLGYKNSKDIKKSEYQNVCKLIKNIVENKEEDNNE